MATAEKTDPYSKARRHAEEVLSDHAMTVLHEDGIYRHLRFQRPETGMYGFDLVTWPGHLSISGDLSGEFVFCRIHDMIDFFARGSDINPGYWAEKITNRGARDGTEAYSLDRLEAAVAERLQQTAECRDTGWLAGTWAAWKAHVEFVDLNYEHAAHQALDSFEYDGYRFDEWYEWRLKDWAHEYLMSCLAIRKGVEMYRAAPSPVVREDH